MGNPNGAAGRIAVTGATGAVGGRVARLLAAAGVPHRLVVRDPSRAPQLPDTEVVQAGYPDRPAMEAALSGIDTVFLVSATETEDRLAQHLNAVDSAVAAGVSKIVYLSFLNAAPDATFTLARQHWATEQHIRGHGVAFTFLRDSLYTDYLPVFAGRDRTIRGPAGDGVVCAVARDDIAAAAVAVLLGTGHDGATYDITGPHALSLHQAAAELSAAAGQPVRYVEETVEQAYASRAHYDAPDWQVAAWVSTYTAIAAGEIATVSDAVGRLTGRDPITVAEWLRRYPNSVDHLR